MTRLLPLMPALILVLAACGGGAAGTDAPATATAEAPDPTATTPATGEETSVFDLAAGDCFDGVQEDIVEVVSRIDCAAPHEYELYAIVNHPGGSDDPYPGNADMSTFAQEECVATFNAFVGSDYETSELYIYNLQPTETTWALGDREVLCALYEPDTMLTGTMEGSNR